MSWAMYDWANSVFATVVIAGFFPVVFRNYWSGSLSASETTFWLGVANALASLLLMCLAPFLGTLADTRMSQKPLLLMFMLIGVCASAFLSVTAEANWSQALLLYGIATMAFMMANVFYDALLVSNSTESTVDRISGLGYGLGYLGGGLSLVICVYISRSPQTFGFEQLIDSLLVSFVLTAFWWFIFSIPLALWTRDEYGSRQAREGVIKQTLRNFRQVFSHQQTRWFLLAYWLYIDGVDTIIRMAVDYGMAIGFDASDLILALLITQFVGFPAAIVYGYLGERYGVKSMLLLGIGVYAVITLLGYAMKTVDDFYYLAALIGLVQGGVQALSRSFYTRLIPAGCAAEYFGIYNMLGKSAAIIGPLLMGGVALITDDHRLSILSIMVLFVAGALLLVKVKDPEAKN